MAGESEFKRDDGDNNVRARGLHAWNSRSPENANDARASLFQRRALFMHRELSSSVTIIVGAAT
jgi:hypothetical protein